MAQQAAPAPQGGGDANIGTIIDAEAKYVRLTEVRADGFVAFDFAIGEPEIYVEMMLPLAAFEAFCADHRVIRLDQTELDAKPGAKPGAKSADSDFLWRLRDAARDAAGPQTPPSPNPCDASLRSQ